jgi:DNA-binding transcriptional ArsR family regulator
MNAGTDVAAVARLIANRPRAAMLDLLLDGETHLAGELARQASVAPSTASGYLASLVEGGLVCVERVGRQHRYRLAGPDVASSLETLAAIAPALPSTSLNEVTATDHLREGRTCYDHLAGRLGVTLTEALVKRRAIVQEGRSFELTPRGERLLEGIGVDIARARSWRRAFAPTCSDWTERRTHLAGALGAVLTDCMFDLRWIQRRPRGRAVLVTPEGETQLAERFGLEQRRGV